MHNRCVHCRERKKDACCKEPEAQPYDMDGQIGDRLEPTIAPDYGTRVRLGEFKFVIGASIKSPR